MVCNSRAETERAVDLIRRISEGRTLVIVEHDMSVVFGLADRISVLVYGEIFASGTPSASRAATSPGFPANRIARLGLGYVPENRDILPTLTVEQNLLLGQKDPRRQGRWRLADMLRMFSNLQPRVDTPAGVLSGGEKQMLTMCRTLMGDPELIMIDEPTEGLAPLIVKQVGELIAEIARRGLAILLVEQKLAIALDISQRVYVMGHGRIVFEGTPADLKGNDKVRHEWLEV